ncbi:MAG: serine/threonine protein phosphatase [Leptospiraceae bacterium]|nr:serine/threonine protein phosphatase [Leptospiraceae bacterium]
MWVIGDVHGCIYELNQLLELIPADDQLIFVGDYVDRGPDSYQVIDRLIRERNRSIFLMGNHESMMLAYYLRPNSREAMSWTYPGNGGLTTLRSYGMSEANTFEAFPENHREFLMNELHLYYEHAEFIVVHAGVRVDLGTRMDDQHPEDLLWIREDWIRREHEWKGKTIFYGHTPARYVLGFEQQHDIIRGEKSFGLDTGCVYGGSLTAMHARTGELIQIPAQRSYI